MRAGWGWGGSGEGRGRGSAPASAGLQNIFLGKRKESKFIQGELVGTAASSAASRCRLFLDSFSVLGGRGRQRCIWSEAPLFYLSAGRQLSGSLFLSPQLFWQQRQLHQISCLSKTWRIPGFFSWPSRTKASWLQRPAGDGAVWVPFPVRARAPPRAGWPDPAAGREQNPRPGDEGRHRSRAETLSLQEPEEKRRRRAAASARAASRKGPVA